MDQLELENKKYQKLADDFLNSSKLISVLKKYGEVKFSGAYEAKLMMHGDVDMRVVRDNKFSEDEILKIFNDLYTNTKFKSYFIKGDWNDPRLGKEFPVGGYIGLKENVDNETWKFDIWFISKTEFKKLEKESIINIDLSSEQRKTILRFKKYRKDHSIKVTGQRIYELVLKNGLKDEKALDTMQSP